MLPLPDLLALVALSLGALMGVGGLLNPHWAANVVRLQPDPAFKGGLAEFRASFGGLFLATHTAGFGLLLATPPEVGAAGLVAVAAIWAGSALGRTVSVLVDGTGTAYNLGSIAFELVMALALLAPLIHILL
jgi:hypothetical protein